MVDQGPLTGCVTLLDEDGRFRAIVKRASRAYLPFEELRTMPLPDGMSADDVWAGLQRILHLSAIDETVPDLAGTMYWYYRTHELSDSISTVLCHCRVGSPLDRQLATAQNRKVLTRLRLDETVAAAQLDGLDIAAEAAYEMLELGRTPQDSTEQVLLNSYDTLVAISDYANRPFSPELFHELLGRLLDSVEPDSWRTVAPRRGLLTADYSLETVAKHGEQQLEHICAYANGEVGDDSDSPVLRALLITDMFRFYRPLPSMNGQLGRLAFKLYALKAGLPVLGALSLSRTKLLWEEGQLGQPLVAMGPEQHASNYARSAPNLTPYYTTGAQLMLAALIDLRENIAALEKLDAELRDLLQDDPAINHRQRSILGRALRNPSAEFTIAHHQRNHQVAYATARADFIDLENRGWLLSEVRGKAFIYRPAPHLRRTITEHEKQASRRRETAPIELPSGSRPAR